jgi:hypothetical protein
MIEGMRFGFATTYIPLNLIYFLKDRQTRCSVSISMSMRGIIFADIKARLPLAFLARGNGLKLLPEFYRYSFQQ